MTKLIATSVFFATFILALASCSSPRYELAYCSNRSGSLEIWLTNSDTSTFRQLTNTPETEYGILWSPDGSSILYTLYKKQDKREINILTLATGNVETIFNDSIARNVLDVSPNNELLLLGTTEHHKKGEIYLFDRKTQRRTRLTDNEFVESGAKFSPDGQSIVTSIQTAQPDSADHGGNAAIFTIRLADLLTKQLTNIPGFSALPDYSPDGRLIAFHTCHDRQCDVYTIRPDGSQLTNLTQKIADNRWPRWSPDGKWIAFTRTDESNNSDIYFITPDGSKMKAVIASKYRDEIADFRPTVPRQKTRRNVAP